MTHGASAAAGGAAISSNPRCPRCGYEQRGIVETWKVTCPLEGTCTECGLTFRWRDVMMPTWAEPRWCVEYGSPRQIPLRGLRTLLLTFLPWKMWSQLQMHHEIRARRIAAYMVVLLACCYVFIAICSGFWAWVYVDGYGGPITSHATPAPAALRALALPFSNEPLGTYTVATRAQSFQMASSGDVTRTVVPHAFRMTTPLAMVLLCSTAAFAALPISRRRAKVRWGHIARVAAYGVGLMVPLWCVLVAALVSAHLEAISTAGSVFIIVYEVLGVVAPIVMLALLPAYVVWWSLATSRYLKMPHAWGVGFAVVLIGVLASLLVLATMGWLL